MPDDFYHERINEFRDSKLGPDGDGVSHSDLLKSYEDVDVDTMGRDVCFSLLRDEKDMISSQISNQYRP